ncbi:uncharacterized protein LOC116690869 [Etheostoma spectabile]|uniref:uncharacterized protein LOC116690869 n=1 Tax=Etheostoma spectabile TaxID=54343 RepID=UPI0013AF5DE7|nr:uncharacterized protein LOC116690869 [Etheostoma spectabile]
MQTSRTWRHETSSGDPKPAAGDPEETLNKTNTRWRQTGNKLNVSRAQWSIDAYCPKDKGRQCTACQKGWFLRDSNCYVFHDAPPDRKTGKKLDKTEERVQIGGLEEEDNNYVNAPAWTEDEVAAPPDQRSLFFSRSSPLIAVCWLILLVIMGLRIYFGTVLESKITNLTADVQNLTTRNQQLETQNQQLETQRNNLTEQIQDLETNWNKLNLSRAQWSIDAYCPKDKGRQCAACQNGWFLYMSNCYVYNNAAPPDQKTWEEARQDCRGKGSDLFVGNSQEDQVALNYYSKGSSGTAGYWFGLRAEGGRWKWIDGRNLTESYWTPQPPPPPATDSQCVMSVQKYKWKSVSCDEKKQWICVMKALKAVSQSTHFP